jgi:AcrR family transcriptional regulator
MTPARQREGRRSSEEQDVRTSTQKTRGAIRDVATEMFCARGYRTSTLEGIGAEVGLTRGSVLHHFSSKADLLAAVTEPYLRALDALLAAVEVTGSPTQDQRRQFVAAVVDLFVEHRGAMRLLANDVAARQELNLTDKWITLRPRVIEALFGVDATAGDEVRAAAAIGAVAHPVAGGWLDVDDREIRGELVEAALRAAGAPDGAASGSDGAASGPDGTASTSRLTAPAVAR